MGVPAVLVSAILSLTALFGVVWQARARSARRLSAAANAHAEREMARLKAAADAYATREIARERLWSRPTNK